MKKFSILELRRIYMDSPVENVTDLMDQLEVIERYSKKPNYHSVRGKNGKFKKKHNPMFKNVLFSSVGFMDLILGLALIITSIMVQEVVFGIALLTLGWVIILGQFI